MFTERLLKLNNINIGVILPTYNRPELLLRAIKSLQSQKYNMWEVYIVDDCSDTDIKSFLEKYGILDDLRVHFFRVEHNLGVNYARNLALEKIFENKSLDCVALLDDDDYFLDDYFYKANKILQDKSIDWLVTKCIDEKRDNITLINKIGFVDYLDYLVGINPINDASMLMRKSIIRDISFTTEFKNGYEWAFFLQISTESMMYVIDMPSKVVTYLDVGLSKSIKKRDNNKKYFQKIIFRNCNYNYYEFLSKKHLVQYKKYNKFVSFFKYIVYNFISKVVN